MYFDLSVPIPGTGKPSGQPQSKKFKGKQPQPSSPEIIYSALQITALENRIDLLIHCEYHPVFPTYACVVSRDNDSRI